MKKSIKWILIILGSLFGLIAIVYIAGSLLPEAHVATRATKFNQTQQTVWEAITDFEGSASWVSFYDSIQGLPDHEGYQAWVMKGEFGEEVEFVDAL